MAWFTRARSTSERPFPGWVRALLTLLCASFTAAGEEFLASALAGNPAVSFEESKPNATETSHWAYQPLRVVDPRVLDVSFEGGLRSPIDVFVMSRLTQSGLSLSPLADPRTLLRRVTYDLTGLPPTEEEMAGFLAQPSVQKYQAVVDRLLASPRHGERWARHWLDVVHYADSHGHDQDRPRPNAWPYRDYVIASFNEDKPYSRFVEEQIAGDVLYPDDPQAIVATGFLAAGPWDESSLLNIMEDTLDKKIAQYLDRDDMISTVMSTFVSTTVHCARCHDHKFDPIPQEEYYGLQAVFAGVDRAERAYDCDPAVARRRRELRSKKEDLERQKEGLDPALLTEDVAAQVARWEKSLEEGEAIWTTLKPQALASSGGATLTLLPDGSIASGGPRPDTDTCKLSASPNLRRISALRLELLTDEMLPHQGPGRQDNGNLHLNELRLSVPPGSVQKAGEPATVVLAEALADFSQDGWTVAMAIDGNPQSAWGIYPEVGKPHLAVFRLKEALDLEPGTTLEVALEQTHGGGHLMGRFRLSVTDAPWPLPPQRTLLPASIVAALATEPRSRTDRQRADLAALYLDLELDRAIASLPPQSKVYAATSDFPREGNFYPAKEPRPIHVMERGDLNRPRELVGPLALSCVAGLARSLALDRLDGEGRRRAALARWITDPRNVLTVRSIVNRVWHYHFGRGIVDTPNDFGKMGGAPSHPELLDWLAADFLENGGSLKRLHRLIVLSETYRQSSRHRPECATVDGDNRLLWRMNRMRLDAESVRDSILQITGRIDLTMGGPPARQFIETPGIHVTPMADYAGFDVDSVESRRRGVYRFVFRTLPDPFLEALDCPDASQLTPVRTTSMTALQALALWNDRFVVRYSEHLADSVVPSSADPSAQVKAAFERVLLRPPEPFESAELDKYAARHGLASLCRVLFNCSELVFID